MSKSLLALSIIILSPFAWAQPDVTSISTAEKPYYSAAMTSNIAELVKGNGNVTIEFFSTPKRSGFFSASFASAKEKRPKLSNAELTVDRTSYSLGMAWYKNDISAKTNMLIAPGIAFGQEKDFTDVDAKSSFEFLLAAQIIPDKTRMKLMGGLKMSNQTGDFKGIAVIALGAMF